MVTSMQIKAKEASCMGEARGLKEGDYREHVLARDMCVQTRVKDMAGFHN